MIRLLSGGGPGGAVGQLLKLAIPVTPMMPRFASCSSGGAGLV